MKTEAGSKPVVTREDLVLGLLAIEATCEAVLVCVRAITREVTRLRKHVQVEDWNSQSESETAASARALDAEGAKM